MGFKNYLKPGKKEEPAAPSESEKTVAAPNGPPGAPSGPPTAWTTPRTSRPGSIYPTGDFRNSTADGLQDIKCDVMVNYLHQQQLELMWTAGSTNEGVVLKKRRDQFTCCPPDLANYENEFFDAVRGLNTRVRKGLPSSLPSY